jgi:hypothetical protein
MISLNPLAIAGVYARDRDDQIINRASPYIERPHASVIVPCDVISYAKRRTRARAHICARHCLGRWNASVSDIPKSRGSIYTRGVRTRSRRRMVKRYDEQERVCVSMSVVQYSSWAERARALF